MTKSAAVSLASHLCLKYKKVSDKPDDVLSSWQKLMKHFMETYATDDVIAETEA